MSKAVTIDVIWNPGNSAYEITNFANTASANFAKVEASSQSMTENLKSHWLAASAAIAAAGLVASKAMAYMQEGARAMQQESSFKIMADEAGVNAERLIGSMKAATKETIDDSAMMQKATKLMLAGYDPKQIEEFSNVAITASQYMGVDVSESFDRISDALASRMPKALVQAGAVTKTQMTVVQEAMKNGADQSDLMALAIANLRVKQLQLQGTQDGATLAMQRFHAEVEDTKESIGKGLIVVTQKLYGVLQAVAVGALEASGGLFKLMSHLPGTDLKKWQLDAEAAFGAAGELAKKSEENMYGLAASSKKASKDEIDSAKDVVAAQMKRMQGIVDSAAASKKAASETENAYKRIAEAIRKAGYEAETAGLSQYDKDIARINSEAEEYRKKGIDKVTVAKYVAAETELASRKAYLVQMEDTKKAMEEQKQGLLDYKKLCAETYEFSASEHETAVNKIIAREDKYLTRLEGLLDKGVIDWERFENTRRQIAENTSLAIAEQKFKELADSANFYRGIIGYEEEYRAQKLAWIDEQSKRQAALYKDDVAAAAWAAQEKGKLEQELFERKTGYIAAGFGNLAVAFDGISKLYKEGSEDAKKWQEVAQAMEIAQRAVAVVNAVAAVAAASAAPFPAGFVAGTAMLAAMGALLASIGESINGSSSASSCASSATTYTGQSTVLGAADGTGSQSIQNSWELLQDTYDMEYTKLTGIYNEMKDLNDNITGLVTSIVRTGSVSGLNVSVPSDTYGSMENLWLNNMNGIVELNEKISDFITGGNKLLQIATGSIIYESVTKLINGAVGWLFNGIFGGRTTSDITEQGLGVSSPTIASLLAGSGASGYSYATVHTHTDGGWFHSDSDSYNKVYGTINSEVTDLFTKVFANLGATLVGLSEELGADTNAALNYSFGSFELNLKDKTTDEINTLVTEQISNMSDTAASVLFGSIIKQYQELNEGLYETAVRLVNDKAIIMHMLDLTNQAFEGTIPAAVALSEKLIDIAGSLEDLTDAFQTYYDAFFSDTEKQIDLQEQLTASLSLYGYDLPGNRAGYRALVESLDMTSLAGQTAYVSLLQMSEAADKYYGYLEDAASSIQESGYATKSEYLRAVAGYADGGISTGPSSGYYAQLHGTELIVSPRSGYPATVVGADSPELLAEIKTEIRTLRQAVEVGNSDRERFTRLLNRWDNDGLPTERIVN
ncbi:MAG: hypothetical protein ABFD75_07425 [Smithella sp.]